MRQYAKGKQDKIAAVTISIDRKHWKEAPSIVRGQTT